MRHAVSEPGRALASKIGLRRGGIARYAVICCSAFLLSGITHMGMVPPAPKSKYSAWELRLRIGGFFFVQPMGIMFEVLVVEKVLAVLGGGRWLTRALRVLWVILFMSLAFRFLIVPFEELGWWRIWPPYFLDENLKSVMRGDCSSWKVLWEPLVARD